MKKEVVVKKETINNEIFFGLLGKDEENLYMPDADVVNLVTFALVKAVYTNIPDYVVFSDSETGAVSPNKLWKKIKKDFLDILYHEYNLVLHPDAVNCFKGINVFFSLIMKESFTTQKFIGKETITITKTDNVYEFVRLDEHSKTHVARLILKPFSNNM
jgi:hypothetical protein|nr:MAG TPA: hypothetical protein [Caudoviricetes sp.]